MSDAASIGTTKPSTKESRSPKRPLPPETDQSAWAYALTPWATEIPARPFSGIMGAAPAATVGKVTSIIPGAFGGNIDNKELVAGSVLYPLVAVRGGLLSVGDGYAAQGDGEAYQRTRHAPREVGRSSSQHIELVA